MLPRQRVWVTFLSTAADERQGQLLMACFTIQKTLSFMMSHLLIVDLSSWANAVIFRKSPMLMISRPFPAFSSMISSVSVFMSRSLTHLELSFMQSQESHGTTNLEALSYMQMM